MRRYTIIAIFMASLICILMTACPPPPPEGNPEDDTPVIEENGNGVETENGATGLGGAGSEDIASEAGDKGPDETPSEVTDEEAAQMEEEPIEEIEPIEEEPMTETEDGTDKIFESYETWPPDAITAEEVEILKRVTVVFETSKGIIKIRVFPDAAPLHSANFVKLVEDGFYDGSPFHRVVADFMSQGGGRPDGSDSGYTLPAEIGLPHKAGSLAAARTDNPEKRSSGSQFYLVHSDTSGANLDGAYTVYGVIVEGQDVNLSLSVNNTGRQSIQGADTDYIIRAWVEMG